MVPETKLRALTLDEMKRLLSAARGHLDETLLIVALALGLRTGELLALRWSDIDFTRKRLAVQRTVHSPGLFAEPKTGSREILLPDFLIKVFQQHQRLQDEAKQAADALWQDHDLVFATPSGGLLDLIYPHYTLREMARAADVPPVLFHALRRTTGILLLSLGVPPQVMQAILGIQHINSPHSLSELASYAAYQDAMAKLDEVFRTLLPTNLRNPSLLDTL